MLRRSALTLALTTLLLTGCFHQVVNTGATPAPGNAAITNDVTPKVDPKIMGFPRYF